MTNVPLILKHKHMDTTTTLAASALGKKSAQKRHKAMKENGVDISKFYSDLRKKGIKNKALTNAGITDKI